MNSIEALKRLRDDIDNALLSEELSPDQKIKMMSIFKMIYNDYHEDL